MAWEIFALIAWMGALWGFCSLFEVACRKTNLLVRFLSTLGVGLCALAFTLISAVTARYWGYDRLVSFPALIDQAIFLAMVHLPWFKILIGFGAIQVLFIADTLLEKWR